MPTADPKPGYKTTEFWLTILAFVIGTVMASGAVANGHWAMQAMGLVLDALAALGYSYSRGQAKKTV